MSKPSSWLETTPPPVVEDLTTLELLAVWGNNRNSIISRAAADEICKRLVRETENERGT